MSVPLATTVTGLPPNWLTAGVQVIAPDSELIDIPEGI